MIESECCKIHKSYIHSEDDNADVKGKWKDLKAKYKKLDNDSVTFSSF